MLRECVCIDVYTVKPGDTLYSIAKKYDIPVSYLMMANRIINPYNLRIGVKLCIPGEKEELPMCKGILHTIASGDTLYMIAKMHRVSLNALMEANPEMDPYNLRIGTKICVPK